MIFHEKNAGHICNSFISESAVLMCGPEYRTADVDKARPKAFANTFFPLSQDHD